MATTTITSAGNLLKPVKQAVGNQAPTVNSVQTKTVQFTVPTGVSGSGYYTGDSLKLASFIPAGTKILGAYWKTSVSQGATLNLQLQSGATNMMTAATLTSTSIAEITLTGGTFSATDADLNIALTGTTVGTTAAVITISLIFAYVDAAAAGNTTYTI